MRLLYRPLFVTVIALLFGATFVFAQTNSDLPRSILEVTLEVPSAHPVVGYPFPVTARFNVHKESTQGVAVEDPPSYLGTAFRAPPPFSGKIEPYIIPDYTPNDIFDGMVKEAEFMCKSIGTQEIIFSADLSYKFKKSNGLIEGRSFDPALSKIVTCVGPKLESFNFSNRCGGSATFSGKIGKEYLSELSSLTIEVNESERSLAGKPTVSTKTDGSFSYTMDLKPSVYHFWVYANTKKGITYELRGEGSFSIDKCDKKEPTTSLIIEGSSCVGVYDGWITGGSFCKDEQTIQHYSCETPDKNACFAIRQQSYDKRDSCDEQFEVTEESLPGQEGSAKRWGCFNFVSGSEEIILGSRNQYWEEQETLCNTNKEKSIFDGCCGFLDAAKACELEAQTLDAKSDKCYADVTYKFNQSFKCDSDQICVQEGDGTYCDTPDAINRPDQNNSAYLKSQNSPSQSTQPKPIIIYAKAFVENQPTDDDLKPVELPEELKNQPLTATITEIDGYADMKLADGTWVILKKGSFIPNDAVVYTGYDATILIQFRDHLVVYLRSLSELSIKQFETDPSVYRTELKLESGELRFKVEESTIKTDMKVSTPNASGSVSGTDWAVSYDKKSGASIYEIYDHSVKVTNSLGETKTVSSSYGSKILRIEVGREGTMTEKTAIPKSEWEEFFDGQQKSGKPKNTWFVLILGIFIIGGIGYSIYRWKTQLLLLWQRIISKYHQPKQ